jgi:hypothetical protein
MKKVAIILVTAVLFAGTVFAASAFTSAELTRTSSIDVASDSNGIITLTPGSNSAVSLNSNDALEINTAGNATGLNVDGKFTYGDNANPSNTYAFSMTNADSQQRSITVAYNNITDNQGQTGAVKFKVYDSTGSQVGTVDSSTNVSITASSGAQYYVVLDVDTSGLDSAADLSGDLVITA